MFREKPYAQTINAACSQQPKGGNYPNVFSVNEQIKCGISIEYHSGIKY